MSDILSLQRLPQMDSLDLDPCNLALSDKTGCQLCTHTCCCTVKEN